MRTVVVARERSGSTRCAAASSLPWYFACGALSITVPITRVVRMLAVARLGSRCWLVRAGITIPGAVSKCRSSRRSGAMVRRTRTAERVLTVGRDSDRRGDGPAMVRIVLARGRDSRGSQTG